MPRVFGRGSRSQPAALVSDRDDAALFPAIRILEGYGSAKSSRARRVRTACRRRGDPKRSSTICCRSFGLRARPSKAGPSPLCLTADAEKPPAEEIMSIGGAHGARKRNRAYLPRLPVLTRRALPDFAEPYLSRIGIAGNKAASSRSLTSAAGGLRLPLPKTRGIERAPRDHSPTGDRRKKRLLRHF